MNSSVSLSEYIIQWLETFKKLTVKFSTYERLVTSANALKKYPISEMPICDITCADIQIYVNQLTEHGYGIETIKKSMRIVTAPLKQAAALHLIPTDPTIGVRLPSRSHVKNPSKAVFSYTPQEQESICWVLESYRRRGYAIILFMLETGLRAGEALALRWDDVNFEGKRLRIHSTVVQLANKKQSFVQDSAKTFSSNRTIPLTPKAIKILRRLPQRHEWVFPDKYGDHLSYEALRYQTQIACREAGVEYHGLHIFRHTFATNCYYKGVDVKILSKILGHADVNITYNVYVHLYGDGFDEMYAALVK